MQRLEELFRTLKGSAPDSVEGLGVSGSSRRYFRLSGAGSSLIGVIGTDEAENRAFITIARHLRGKGIHVPEVLAVSSDGLYYLQEDLGSVSLFDAIAQGRNAGGEYSESERELLCSAIAALPRIQFEGAKGMDWSVCFPDREFNSRMVRFDLNYFKYCFLKTSGASFDEIRLQDDFDRLEEDLLACPSDCLMYRDFQTRNVMLKDGEPWFIDFQGARKGPLWYDVASFIYQARSRFGAELCDELVDAYLEALKPWRDIPKAEFMSTLRIFALFRMLQVLGAYGFRGRFEKKAHFLESIPFAMAGLRELLSEPFSRYPYLSELLLKIAQETASEPMEGPLEVRIFSFSFRKGIPEDESGNGGGYVFDCRGIPNPGRYERYKHSTGMDADVSTFLESKPEARRFIDNVISIVEPHVENYIERGFTSLQVSFGCTGGQHRSVWCAEKLARALRSKYRIKVVLHHIEQGKSSPEQ